MPPKFPAVILFPWEQDGIVGRLLRGEQLLDGAVVVPSMTTTAGGLLSKDGVVAIARDKSSEHSSPTSAHMDAPLPLSLPAKRARKTGNISAKPIDADRRNEALLAILTILTMVPAATVIGAKVAAAEAGEAIRLVRLALIKKRTNTLLTRLAAINAYLRWAVKKQLKWPPAEGELYDYLQVACTSASPATRASSILGAVRFWHHDFKGTLGHIIDDPILEGWSIEQMQRLGVRQQCDILPRLVLESWENILVNGVLPKHELLIIGVFLLHVALRARHSDLDHLLGISNKDGMIEVMVSQTKNSGAIGDRLKLSLIGPELLLTGHKWFDSWMDLRQQMEIPIPGFPIFPSRQHGKWGKTPAAFGAFNSALHAILSREASPVAGKFTSHSLKTTLLAWSASFGLHKDDRATLGYHRASKDSSVRIMLVIP